MLQKVVKDMNQQPDEEIQRERYQTKELLSWSLGPGMVTRGGIILVQQPVSSLNLVLLGFNGGFIT